VPSGLVFEPAFVSPDEQQQLLVHVEQLEFREVVMHGVPARRTARHFGVDYDYAQREHSELAEPIPQWLLPLRDRSAALAGVDRDALGEALVQRYPQGSTIG
jgi:alkylated DNA repair dioxygenase AlkB